MSAAAAIARAERAGVKLFLLGDKVRMVATAPPPEAIVTALRDFREDVVVLLSARRAVASSAPPAEPPGSLWPEGSDYSLTKDAVEIAHILDDGGEARWCPNHGLDITRADGRYLGISPSRAEKLKSLGLLPPQMMAEAEQVSTQYAHTRTATELHSNPDIEGGLNDQ